MWTLGGARVTRLLAGAREALSLGGAQETLNWTEPAETKVSWTRPAETKVSTTHLSVSGPFICQGRVIQEGRRKLQVSRIGFNEHNTGNTM